MKPIISKLAMVLLLAVAGCGGKEDAAANAPAKPKEKAGSAAAGSTAGEAAATNAGPVVVSVFATNAMKDPFFPRAKAVDLEPAKTASGSPAAPPSGAAIQAALQAGFVGVFGNPEERIGLIRPDVQLRPGRSVTIPLVIEGRAQRVNARVVRVVRNAVELQVEGVAQPVTLTVQSRKF